MKPFNNTWKIRLITAVAVGGLAAGLVQATSTKARQDCPESWEDFLGMTHDERSHCMRVTNLLVEQSEATAKAMAIQASTQHPRTATPTRTAQEQRLAMRTPTAYPMTLVPERKRQIKDISDHPSMIQDLQWKTSLWRVGVVPTYNDHSYAYYYLWSTPAKASHGPMIGVYIDGRDALGYTLEVEAPKDKDIGEIVITGVTGPGGVVSFTTTTGLRGTFDLATRAWAFAQ